jgi:hypothetical protein
MAPRLHAKLPADTPARCDVFVAHSIKALNTGKATEEQQKAALHWIINSAAQTYDNPFRPGRPDEMNFICGQMFVGQQIIEVIKAPIEQFKDKVEEPYGRTATRRSHR